MISQEPDLDKTYLYAKDSCEAKFKFLINKREKTVFKQHYNDSKVLNEYSNDMNDIYPKLENSIEIKKVKHQSFLMIWLLICLVEKDNPIVTELNISFVFMTKSNFVGYTKFYAFFYYENSKQIRNLANSI